MIFEDLDPRVLEAFVSYIKKFFEINKIFVDVEIETQEEGRLLVSVKSDHINSSKFTSHQFVFSFQHLLRLLSKKLTNRFHNIILEIGDSKEKRRAQLEKMVDESIAKIESGLSFCTLSYMSSYERKIVHDIASSRGYISKSDGEGINRRISIMK